MKEVTTTRLRFVAAKTAEEISLFVSSLPQKVELKGSPSLEADGLWYVWFVIPDIVPDEFQSVRFPG